MEEIQQIILWRQKIDDLWSSFGLDPLHGKSREMSRPDWRANARPHKAQNYIRDYQFRHQGDQAGTDTRGIISAVHK